MGIKVYSAVAMLGLVAARLATAGSPEYSPFTPTLEWGIGSRIWHLAGPTSLVPSDSMEINLALCDPRLLFEAPRDFFTFSLRFESNPATGVVFTTSPDESGSAP